MDQGQQSIYARELFTSLRDHVGHDPYAAVVVPWLSRAEVGYRGRLADATDRLCRETFDGPATVRADLSWELYALSRVSDVLLLPFQPPAATAEEAPWARRVHPLDQRPGLDMTQYLQIFTQLGLAPFDETGTFDPFLHEVVEVEQAEDPDEPARVTGLVWPGLWLGRLLFSRAGVRIRAGVHHAERGVADRSPLYWTFVRRHRPTVDLSHGWGHNSQWRTEFRLDYRTETGELVNADGCEDIDANEDVDFPSALLTPEERRHLVRNRCLLRTPVNASALAATSSWEMELFPFDWRLPASEARHSA
ncbi:hypothetical protein ACIQOF_07215 [Streptomyces sp. NPDC091265]|uniref:hypothetical protein n=1 Tax=unclassified Streptomyces TaxID=2593676 RepID=UPI00344C3C68